MISSLLIAAAVVAATPEFEARMLDGQVVRGSLVGVSADAIALDPGDGVKKLPLDSLAALQSRDSDPTSYRKATLWLELVDGSGISGTEYSVKGQQARLKLPSGRELSLTTAAIRSVRFTPPGDRDAKLAEQWASAAATNAAADLLVVRKTGSLDYLEGVMGDIDAETVKFDLEGEVVPVKRARVEGVVYFHAPQTKRREPLANLTTGEGSKLAVAEAKLVEGALAITTPSGVSVSWPLEQIQRIDYSSGKIAYLSDWEPDSVSYTPFLTLKEEPASFREFYRVRRDTGFEQLPLKLNGSTYAKGLSLRSRTVLGYKLPAKFQRFQATVGIDDSVREIGSVNLSIKGDGETLWQGDVRGTDPPQQLELEIDGVKRLEIVADYGEDQDIGDRLNLADARVTK